MEIDMFFFQEFSGLLRESIYKKTKKQYIGLEVCLNPHALNI